VNTVEDYFGLLKRGVMGTYHHWSSQHLHRYLNLSEFDYRYNARKIIDVERAEIAVRMAGQATHDGTILGARQLVPARRSVQLRLPSRR
jgi:hypothetical protein